MKPSRYELKITLEQKSTTSATFGSYSPYFLDNISNTQRFANLMEWIAVAKTQSQRAVSHKSPIFEAPRKVGSATAASVSARLYTEHMGSFAPRQWTWKPRRIKATTNVLSRLDVESVGGTAKGK